MKTSSELSDINYTAIPITYHKVEIEQRVKVTKIQLNPYLDPMIINENLV